MQITAVFPTGRGVDWWAARNATSPVPGRWPYGLDRLTEGVDDAHRVDVAEVGGVGRLRRVIASRTGLRPFAARGGQGRAAFCWDESLAPAMLTHVRAERRFAGVIWVTDRLHDASRRAEVEIIRDALMQMDGLWVLSRPQIDAVRDWLGPNCPPVHFLGFGVDPTFYRAAGYPGSGSESTAGDKAAGPLVVSVGGDRDRDPATLYAALDLVSRQRPETRFFVQSKSELTPPAGVERESFVPHDRVRRLYAEASVVALATRPNLHGSGMTVGLEAMSVGRPVVASSTPGMDDYIEDGRTGFLVPPGDPEALAARICELLADPQGASAMGQRAQVQVRERHNTDVMCRELLKILGV